MHVTTWNNILYRYKDEARITNAVIVITVDDDPEKRITDYSDHNGEFNIEIKFEKSWSAQILHSDSRSKNLGPYDASNEPDKERIELQDIASAEDNKAGANFLMWSAISLVCLAFLYIFLHSRTPSAIGPLSVSVISQIESIEKNKSVPLAKAEEKQKNLKIVLDHLIILLKKNNNGDKVLIDSLEAISENGSYDKIETWRQVLLRDTLLNKETESLFVGLTLRESNKSFYKKQIDSLGKVINVVLRNDKWLANGDKVEYMEQLSTVCQALETDDWQSFRQELRKLKKLVSKPPIKGYIPWTKFPWQMLEILFWALGGILASKIMETGYYLRFSSFLKSGINMHLSHIVAVPFLVLVVMMILSLVSFQLNVSGGTSTATVDLSNEYILAALSFILALRPWSVRKYIGTIGSKITEQSG